MYLKGISLVTQTKLLDCVCFTFGRNEKLNLRDPGGYLLI